MTTSELPIATEPQRMPGWLDEIGAPWLTTAMRSTGTIDALTTVDDVTWELLGEGEGFLGDLARLHITYEGGTGPDTAVIKVPTRKPENRGLAYLIGAYEFEVRFYNELASAVDVRVPTPYFAAIEDNPRSAVILQRALDLLPDQVTLWLLPRLTAAAGKSDRRTLVLMEDLGEARIGDQVAGASLQDAQHSVDMLARFHATFWRSPLLQKPWLIHQDDNAAVTQRLFERAFPVFEQRFHDQIDDHTRGVLEALLARGPDLLRRVAAGPTTLTHGDFRMDNIAFFDGAPDPAAMLDFQAITVGHPLTDVAYFLRPNMNPEVINPNEDALLRRYHDALVQHGVTDYPFETLEAEYELAQLWVLHRGVILIGTLDLSHERGVQIVERAIERALHSPHQLQPDRWF
jgi:hypothetical protein